MAEQEIGLPPTPATPSPQGQNRPETPIKLDLIEEAKKIVSGEQLLDLIISHPIEDFLPWEKVQLPSLGMFYDGKIPNGEIQVRPMSIVSDKIFATPRLAQTGQAIDHVFRYCVKFPTEFDPLNLLVGDRMFLLFYLRGITHGNNYEFSITCTNDACKLMSNHNYDLNEIGKTIRNPKNTQEPIRIILPSLSKQFGKEIWVEVRFMRGYDLQIITRNMKQREIMTGGRAKSVEGQRKGPIFLRESENVALDQTIEENLNLLIVSVNGARDRNKIKEFVGRLPGQDTAVIRETLKNAQPGINTEIVVVCPHCQAEMKIDLPITESFFRSTEHGGTGE